MLHLCVSSAAAVGFRQLAARQSCLFLAGGALGLYSAQQESLQLHRAVRSPSCWPGCLLLVPFVDRYFAWVRTVGAGAMETHVSQALLATGVLLEQVEVPMAIG